VSDVIGGVSENHLKRARCHLKSIIGELRLPRYRPAATGRGERGRQRQEDLGASGLSIAWNYAVHRGIGHGVAQVARIQLGGGITADLTEQVMHYIHYPLG